MIKKIKINFHSLNAKLHSFFLFVNQSVKGELCKIFDEGRMVLKTLNKFYMLGKQ